MIKKGKKNFILIILIIMIKLLMKLKQKDYLKKLYYDN
jgi:hypothetical protein